MFCHRYNSFEVRSLRHILHDVLMCVLEWHGVVFVRSGMYRSGIFKFVIEIPESYPEVGPSVRFSSRIFHPLINVDSGELETKQQFRVWRPSQHYIVHIVAFVKAIFYKTDLWNSSTFNEEAKQLYEAQSDKFEEAVQQCISQSHNSVYINDDESSLRFSQPQHSHELLRRRVQEVYCVSSSVFVFRACDVYSP